MPEAGYLPIPGKLARAGVKDMVRISDARMSGTAYGTVVLHVAPEAAAGGPLAAVRNGDRIALSVARNGASTCWSTSAKSRGASPAWRRRRARRAATPRSTTAASCRRPQGCDFDFLTGVERPHANGLAASGERSSRRSRLRALAYLRSPLLARLLGRGSSRLQRAVLSEPRSAPPSIRCRRGSSAAGR